MRLATLAIIGAYLRPAGAQGLQAPFPGTGDNPYLDLIDPQDPGLHASAPSTTRHQPWP